VRLFAWPYNPKSPQGCLCPRVQTAEREYQRQLQMLGPQRAPP